MALVALVPWGGVGARAVGVQWALVYFSGKCEVPKAKQLTSTQRILKEIPGRKKRLYAGGAAARPRVGEWEDRIWGTSWLPPGLQRKFSILPWCTVLHGAAVHCSV